MFNEARTLLLNVDATRYLPTEFGEPMPLSFQTVPLSDALLRVRRVLFGANPDALMLDWRARQCLWCIASTRVQSSLAELDSRVTYDTQCPCATLSVTSTCRNLDDNTLATISGTGNPSDDTGVTLNKRLFKVLDETTAELMSVTSQAATVNVTVSAGGWLQVPSTRLSVRLNMVPDSRWLLTTTTPPDRTVADLLRGLVQLGEPVIDSLFDVGSDFGVTSPMLDLHNTWVLSRIATERFSAAVAALILQTKRLHRARPS